MENRRDPNDRWLFRSHSRAELEDWARRMRFFRFCRAIGGHANDGDQLLVAVRITSESDLVAVASALGIALRELPADAPVPQPGRAYRGDEMAAFRTRIDAHPRFEQPGHVTLAGARCFAWVHPGRLEIALAGADGDPYEVTERDVENALALEPLLSPLADRIIDPPCEGDRCVLP
jgi:hypothetical protein